MKNIETKFYSSDITKNSIKRIITAYIIFAAVRIVLYLTVGISISRNISLGSTYFFYQDGLTLIQLFVMGFIYLILFIASIVLLASCLNIVSDLDDSYDINKRLYLYLIPMILDIFGGLIFASIWVVRYVASFVGILISLIEIGLFIWLLASAKEDNQNISK